MFALETFRSLYFKTLRERGMSVSLLVRYGFVLNELSDFMGFTDPSAWTATDLEHFYTFRKPHLSHTLARELEEAIAILVLLIGGGDTRPPACLSPCENAQSRPVATGDIGLGTSEFPRVEQTQYSAPAPSRENGTQPNHSQPLPQAEPKDLSQWKQGKTAHRLERAGSHVHIDVIPDPNAYILALSWEQTDDHALNTAFQRALSMTRERGCARWVIDTRNGSARVLQAGHWFPHWLLQAHRMGVEHCAVVVTQPEKISMRHFGLLDTTENKAVSTIPAPPPTISFFGSLGGALAWLRDPI